MHLTTTSPQKSRDAIMRPQRKENFSTKVLFTEFGSHETIFGAQKNLFSIKNLYLKKCAVGTP